MIRTTLDPYATLGVPRGASQQQVQQAYRRLAKRYHPDLHPEAELSERMRRVNQAWQILSNPVRRARYDAGSASRGPASARHWSAPRRSTSMGTARMWNETWTSPQARAHSRTGSRPHADADVPGWAGVALTVALGLIAVFVLLAGILPFPLAGIALLVLVRGIFGRFGEDGS